MWHESKARNLFSSPSPPSQAQGLTLSGGFSIFSFLWFFFQTIFSTLSQVLWSFFSLSLKDIEEHLTIRQDAFHCTNAVPQKHFISQKLNAGLEGMKMRVHEG